MFKLIFFVPVDDAPGVKGALFDLGLGRLGNYDRCSFETQGIGQFRALDGANPSVGELMKVEKVTELKVEMLCPESLISLAIEALKKAHPYEVPAYEVYRLEEF